MKEGVRRLLVIAMTVVDTKYRCSQIKPLMVVPFVVDERNERIIETKRRERERERERESLRERSTTKET